jgi:signal transduction histidine kinase
VLYLVREAVSNVLRHASATVVQIELTRWENGVLLQVNDNGRGFEAPAGPGGRHHGLHNMAERARLIGGRLVVNSHAGEGTRICLEVAHPA